MILRMLKWQSRMGKGRNESLVKYEEGKGQWQRKILACKAKLEVMLESENVLLVISMTVESIHHRLIEHIYWMFSGS